MQILLASSDRATRERLGTVSAELIHGCLPSLPLVGSRSPELMRVSWRTELAAFDTAFGRAR